MAEASGRDVMGNQKSVMLPAPCKNEYETANDIEKRMDGLKTLEKQTPDSRLTDTQRTTVLKEYMRNWRRDN